MGVVLVIPVVVLVVLYIEVDPFGDADAHVDFDEHALPPVPMESSIRTVLPQSGVAHMRMLWDGPIVEVTLAVTLLLIALSALGCLVVLALAYCNVISLGFQRNSHPKQRSDAARSANGMLAPNEEVHDAHKEIEAPRDHRAVHPSNGGVRCRQRIHGSNQ